MPPHRFHPLDWKIGFEVELLAPSGKDRAQLARAFSAALGGEIRPFFHLEDDSVPERPGQLFHVLSLGFGVERDGRPLLRLADDLTLKRDLDARAPARADWYRLVTDDRRLAGLATRVAIAGSPLDEVLTPLHELFGGTLEPTDPLTWQLRDPQGLPLFTASAWGGERERGCELITAPLERDHLEQLGALLAIAREAGCLVPVEGATHLHFDAERLRNAAALRNLVLLVAPRLALLRALAATNPNCTRLGPWPAGLVARVTPPSFAELSWPEARDGLLSQQPTKYCDLNLVNLLRELPHKHTVEWRIVPATFELEHLGRVSVLLERVMQWAASAAPDSVGPSETVPVTRAAALALCELVGVDAQLAGQLAERLPTGS